MWSVRKLFVFIGLCGLLAGCGSSGSGQSAESPNFVALGGTIRITSNKFTPPGYPWNIIVVVAQPAPAPTPSQNPGSGEAVLPGDNPAPAPAPETPPAPAPTGHVLVTGSVVHSGYAGGDILLEIRPTTSCGSDVCADLNVKPLAAVKIAKPGYFAVVMGKTDANVYLVATYSHPTDGTSTRDHNLGVVAERVNGIVLDFSPEAPPATEPPAEGGTLSPEDAQALGDLFREAEEAQDSLNDMIRDALGSLPI